jgi:Fur family ferric uptake transcriptional regulator
MQHCCDNNLRKMKSPRNTIAKTEIQELILSSKSALSHAEIQSILIGLCDRVTIYRVLERLLEEGLIHKTVNVDGVVRYAGCHSCSEKHNHNHIHFSCQKCKSVTCLDEVEPSYKLPKNYKVCEMNFTLSGFCPQCL